MRLKVRIYNPQYEKRHLYAKNHPIPEYSEYFGEVYPSEKRNEDDTFRLKDLHTGFIRKIPKADIICGWKYD